VLTLLASFLLALRPTELHASVEPYLSNKSIVHTQQIQIPGYPNAYNASFVPYQEGYLLSFRARGKFPETQKNPFRADYSLIGLVKLDKSFKVLKKTVQLLGIVSHSPSFSLTAEDARLLKVGDRLFVFFNDSPPNQVHAGFAMYFGELIESHGEFQFRENPKHIRYASAIQVEKNWSPFFSDGKFYLIYSDQPRIILELDPSSGCAHEIAFMEGKENWSWGRIRGGTPSHLVDGAFLTFFHSYRFNYVMGAYMFEPTPPFAIQSISPTPLGDVSYYTEENPIKVLFPCGLVVEDKFIHVVGGKADKQIFLTTFDKQRLLEELR
jgi:predicted GH43/DUF377 family glycosyl hydrolase